MKYALVSIILFTSTLLHRRRQISKIYGENCMRNMKWELECTVTCAMWSIWGVCVIYIEICVCVCVTCPIISCTSRKREWIIRKGDFIRGIFLIQVRGPWIKTALSLFTLYSRLTKLFLYISQMLSIRSKRIKWWWNAKTNQFLKRKKVKERQKVNEENEYE